MKAVEKIPLYLWGGSKLARLGRPDLCLGFLGGIGDDLLCTAAIEEHLRRGVRRLWFFTRHPELYAHYGDRVRLVPEDPRLMRLADRIRRPIRYLCYSVYDPESDRDPPPSEHILARMCRLSGLTGKVALRPWLSLRKEEVAAAARFEGAVVLQCGGMDAAVPMLNKQWPPAQASRLPALLAGHRRPLVQIGTLSDPPLPGVVDLRGKTTLRESATILRQARLFIGGVGFAMHLARAVDCPSVIVYGGREIPESSGYPCNRNLVRRPACSPCWQRNRCSQDRVCLDSISPEEVASAAAELLALDRAPLATEEVEL